MSYPSFRSPLGINRGNSSHLYFLIKGVIYIFQSTLIVSDPMNYKISLKHIINAFKSKNIRKFGSVW